MYNVYLITNLQNDKKYVGITTRTIQTRFEEHWAKRFQGSALGTALQKYGKENFEIKLIYEAQNKEEMFMKEREYIQFYNSYYYGYNRTFGGEGGPEVEQDDELIIATYLEEKSSTKTASKLNIGSNTVLRRLKANNIDLFGSGFEASQRVSAEEIYNHYYSTKDINVTAEYFGIGKKTAYRKLREANLPLFKFGLNPEEEDDIIYQYTKENKSITQIGNEYCINRKTVAQILKYHNILISNARTGKALSVKFIDGSLKSFENKTQCANFLITNKLVPQTSAKYVVEKINISLKTNTPYENLTFIIS